MRFSNTSESSKALDAVVWTVLIVLWAGTIGTLAYAVTILYRMVTR